MVSRAATALVLLLAAASAASAARPVQQQPPADGGEVSTLKPVSLGDGSQRLLTRGYFKAQGGSMTALGRPTLLALKRSSRFRGSVESFAAHLDKEKDLGVDAVNKALLYQCKGLTANVSASEVKTAGAVSAADPTLTAAQAFSLSSRPSATRKLLLDFDGHTTTGTWWNDFVGRQNIVTPPYDTDSSPNTWSASELSDIVAIWRAVSEDYAMFDVDVTTIDPGNAALTGQGMRVAIGGAWSDWYTTAAGGVAYVSSFGAANVPCFIFPKNLGPDYAKYIWEATSHELGHTLGLSHDGVVGGSAYYSGQGDWAPIMGTGYSKSVTQFNKGEYAGSNNQQDDLAVMSGFLPLLQTTAGTSQATAAPLAGTVDAVTGRTTANVQGVVATAAGAWYSFEAAAGSVKLSASVVAPWGGATNRANLDIQLAVYDAAGTVLATLNPAGADAANLGVPATSVTLPAAGTYVVAVTGAGAGDPASTGYSSYGSRGQFELTADYSPCTTCNDALRQASPSPAPTPTPSPSPSPAPVQPSPVPSPSPSPPPAQPQALRVTNIAMAKVPQPSNRLACSVTVYIKDTAGNPVANVRVDGTFAVQPALATFTSANSGTTAAAGTVALRSTNTVPKTGYTCVFSINNMTPPAGYYFDAANSVLTKTLLLT